MIKKSLASRGACLALSLTLCVLVSPLVAADPGAEREANELVAIGLVEELRNGEQQHTDTPPSPPEVFDALPSNEQRLSLLHERAPGDDERLEALSDGSARIVVFTLEGWRPRASVSLDGGVSFLHHTDPFGAGFDVLSMRAARAPDGAVYLVGEHVGSEGRRGVLFARSDDMGQTWNPVQELVAPTDDVHGVAKAALAAGPDGRVAITFLGAAYTDPYVLTSLDHGTSWGDPVRANPSAPAGVYGGGTIRAAFAADGTLHVAYVQRRTGSQTTWYTRSTDGGQSFEAARDLGSLLSVQWGSYDPAIAIAADGSVLVAGYDYYNSGTVYLVRSSNGGDSFSLVYEWPALMMGLTDAHQLVTDRATGSVAHAFLNEYTLTVVTSTNYGQSFGAARELSTENVFQHRLHRTDDGTWLVAWWEASSLDASLAQDGVNARSSTDEGANWNARVRVDDNAPGEFYATIPRIVPLEGDEVFVAFLDSRDELNRSTSAYGARGVASSLTFGTNLRIDDDDNQSPVGTSRYGYLASAGSNHLFVTYLATNPGPTRDAYVASSHDRGRSFGNPVMLGDEEPGTSSREMGRIATGPGGRVFAVTRRHTGRGWNSPYELRFHRSVDNGESFDGDLTLDTVSSTSVGYPEPQIAAPSTDLVYVLYSDRYDVILRRSEDGGASFGDPIHIPSVTGSTNTHPRLCASGDDVLVVFQSAEIEAATSHDRGQTWVSQSGFGSDTVNVTGVALACGEGLAAVAVYATRVTGGATQYGLSARAFDGSTWSSAVSVKPLDGERVNDLQAAFASNDDIVVTWEQTTPYTVTAAHSPDRGASFSAPTVLSPETRYAANPQLASDGAGNAWIAWIDKPVSYDAYSVAIRHSADGGSEFAPAKRLDTAVPAATYYNDADPRWAQGAALPGVGLFTWGAHRVGYRTELLLNGHAPADLDRDGVDTAIDCAPEDPELWAAPSEVTGLELALEGADTRLSWLSLAESSGPGTRYDLVTGTLGALLASGGYAGASCLASDLAETSFLDERPAPAAKDGVYFLVRARSACGTGSYGDAPVSPDPRDTLDQAGPCP